MPEWADFVQGHWTPVEVEELRRLALIYSSLYLIPEGTCTRSETS